MVNTKFPPASSLVLQRGRWWVWCACRLIGAGIFLWFLGFLVFVYVLIPLTITEPHAETDGIVVWTGGACRVTRGFESLAAALAPRLLISGVPKNQVKERLVEQLCETHLTPEVLRSLLTGTEMGKQAASTVGNGWETAAWAKRHNLRSIRLVTSAMHMPRARVVFRCFLPDVVLVVHPVVVEREHPYDWYQHYTLAMKLAREYTKYLFSWVQCRCS